MNNRLVHKIPTEVLGKVEPDGVPDSIGFETPLVSVILLSYNQAEYLLDAVESVISQTYSNWELIVIDNGSTDESQVMLQRYAEHPRIRLVFHERNGQITTRSNEGVRLSRGEFVSFLYSDDYYLPTKLEFQIRAFANLDEKWGIVHGPGYSLNVFSGATKLVPCIKASGYVIRDLLTKYAQGYINPLVPLVRRTCLLDMPFYEDLFTESEDIYFRLALKYKFFYLDEPLVVMRQHDKNARFAGKRNVEIADATLARLGKISEFPLDCRPALRHLHGTTLRNYAWQNLRMAPDGKWARSIYRRAVLVDWHQLFTLKTIVGWPLTYFPKSALKRINSVANRVRGSGGVYLEDYS